MQDGLGRLAGRLMGTVLRRSVEQVFDTSASTAANAAIGVATEATSKQYHQSFEVTLPTTIYVRASQSTVTVRYGTPNLVEIVASLRAAFGWELVAEHDEAGLYIVAKRKPMVGRLSAAAFTITVPSAARLIFDLTAGSIHFENVDGKLDIPGLEERNPAGQGKSAS